MEYTLSLSDRRDLELLLTDNKSDKTLVNHYKTVKYLYEKWLADISDDQIDALGNDGKTIVKTTYGTEDILEILAGRIEKFDKGLNRLFHQEKTKERIGFEHKAVCVLFARNIVAKNQVQVANK